MSETLWRPRKPHTMIVLPYLTDGATKSGIVVAHHEKKMPNVGLVLDTNDVQACDPGDVVLFREGFGEPLMDSVGEKFSLVREDHVMHTMESI